MQRLMIQNIMLVVYQGSIENDFILKGFGLMITLNIFPQRLKELRLEKGLTQTELANMLGISQKSYSHWETGKNEPNLENLIKLADLLEVSLDWLFGRE